MQSNHPISTAGVLLTGKRGFWGGGGTRYSGKRGVEVEEAPPVGPREYQNGCSMALAAVDPAPPGRWGRHGCPSPKRWCGGGLAYSGTIPFATCIGPPSDCGPPYEGAEGTWQELVGRLRLELASVVSGG